ncbi:amidohydrolase [Candidatus Epulonipiscium fishelsonii]|uniref:Amidohydrolase n=2 Tax=Candidatus Epulonipiscium fishelsonii TaxID=77094 RepID=A0ACC8XGC0_9FIRM|nr:amidohydrolase [Epulopiscium sp. SCG-B11WGA-EpuloA1]ONI42416.1 amidohydrolase [Epulopiscium sp. SCG-B11WGA-EpuloA1]ONI43822.1 amidohydrolase [Epulopiscium sp. SCG-B05WGA-EpuloA1]
MNLKAGILAQANKLCPYLEDLYHHFHANPELANKEINTADKIVKELEKIGGYDIKKNVGGNGVVATLEGACKGPMVALRADMDALAVEEQTGLKYASNNKGVMHACGHDAHMTIALGAARLLAECKPYLKGSVRIIFQPAEELVPNGGAKQMIEEGALEGVDAIFGLHVFPDPNLGLGTFGFRERELMAASDKIEVEIIGKGAHAAQPNQGVDALVTGAQFVSIVQSIISRNVDPLESAVLTFGSFQSGNQYNIVSENCLIEGTCRTYDPKIRDLMEVRIENVLSGVCFAAGADYKFKYNRGYPALINNPEMTEYAKNAAKSLFGDAKVYDIPKPSMTAEDFAVYLKSVPGTFFFLGCTSAPDAKPLHNSGFKLDEDVLWRGVAMFTELALNFHKIV